MLRDPVRRRRIGWWGSCRLPEPCIDLLTQERKIERLGQKRLGAALDRLASRLRIAIGRDHDDGNVGPQRPDLRQHLKPAHARHVDVGQDENQRGITHLACPLKCRRSRLRELHLKPPGAQFAAKLLAKQRFNIRLVIDDENVNTQIQPPAFPCAASSRGSVMMNSVNTPGSVSTSIVPPCCFTTMSWLMERPRPVPSPAGLVVKNGLNIFSLTSAGIPVPLSRILISTWEPEPLVLAVTTGSKPAPPLSALRLVTA